MCKLDKLSPSFIQKQKSWLLARRESKTRILQEGGFHASLHSPKDIDRIDFALKRIDEEQYGLCVGCGCCIEIGRLNFAPEILFCFSCQNDIEKERSKK